MHPQLWEDHADGTYFVCRVSYPSEEQPLASEPVCICMPPTQRSELLRTQVQLVNGGAHAKMTPVDR